MSSTPVDLVNDTLYDDLAGSSIGGNEIYGTAGLTANTIGVQNTILGNDGRASTPLSPTAPTAPGRPRSRLASTSATTSPPTTHV